MCQDSAKNEVVHHKSDLDRARVAAGTIDLECRHAGDLRIGNDQGAAAEGLGILATSHRSDVYTDEFAAEALPRIKDVVVDGRIKRSRDGSFLESFHALELVYALPDAISVLRSRSGVADTTKRGEVVTPDGSCYPVLTLGAGSNLHHGGY